MVKKQEAGITGGKREKYAKAWQQNKYAYLLILPSVIFVFIFSYLPFLGIVLAFKDFDIVKGIWGSPWVGFQNFVEIFRQPSMLKAIGNTLLYGFVTVFGTFPFPVILALLLNELIFVRFKKVVQTISYMPYFISWVSVVGIFYSVFAMDGVYNILMSKIFGEAYVAKNILMDSKSFLPIIFVSNIWKSVGWSSVIFLAAIAGVDSSLYEAVKIDGGGRIRQIWHITLPCIRNTMIVVLVMSLGGLFSSNFEQVYGFQNVYIQDDTEVINTLIYRMGIQNGNYSQATAFGLAQGLVTLFTILCSNWISKRVFQASIW